MIVRHTLSLLLLCLSFAGAVHAAPVFHFESNRVAISGITPKGSVYAFSLSREAQGMFSDVVPREMLLRDDDGAGVVHWQLGGDVALRSIWLAVDMAGGTPAVATPPGFEATRVDLSDVNLKKEFGSGAGQLSFGGDFVQFVVVRPGAGGWRAAASRRGTDDEGTDPDRPTLSVEKLQAKAGTKNAAPRHLQRGDVVLMVSSFRAEYGLAVMGE